MAGGRRIVSFSELVPPCFHLPANWLAPCFVKLRMISAEIAPHSISTKRGLTAPRRNASRRGISYYSRYEKQTYSLRL